MEASTATAAAETSATTAAAEPATAVAASSAAITTASAAVASAIATAVTAIASAIATAVTAIASAIAIAAVVPAAIAITKPYADAIASVGVATISVGIAMSIRIAGVRVSRRIGISSVVAGGSSSVGGVVIACNSLLTAAIRSLPFIVVGFSLIPTVLVVAHRLARVGIVAAGIRARRWSGARDWGGLSLRVRIGS
jgi:hypothetical protein